MAFTSLMQEASRSPYRASPLCHITIAAYDLSKKDVIRGQIVDRRTLRSPRDDRNTLLLGLERQGDPPGFDPGMTVWLAEEP